MEKESTVKISNADLLVGEKLYVKRARKVLPYLVRQVKAGKTIFYSDLAEEVNIPNPRNLNFVLGAIGNALKSLEKTTSKKIPPIQCLVISKSTGLPGEGIEWLVSKSTFKKLSKGQQREFVNRYLADIFTFPDWDWVLEQLELKPLTTNITDLLNKTKQIGFGGGESAQHKDFKLAIANKPSLLKLKVSIGMTEYKLASADCIDVLFTNDDQLIAVEVKSSISSTLDILRGLFQCVKYKYLIEAEQAVQDKTLNSRVILALQGQFPNQLLAIKNILGIEVIDGIKM